MEIRYIGGTSFVLKGDVTVAVDPQDGAPADVVLPATPQGPRSAIVSGPGEYEIAGVLIATVATGKYLAHGVEIGGIQVAYVAEPAGLRPADLEALGRVDVLLVDAGSVEAAQGAVRALEPRVIIPFGNGAEAVVRLLGGTTEPEARFAWDGAGKAPRALLLKASTGRKRVA